MVKGGGTRGFLREKGQGIVKGERARWLSGEKGPGGCQGRRDQGGCQGTMGL